MDLLQKRSPYCRSYFFIFDLICQSLNPIRIAGSDTTSNSMTAIVHLIMSHPHVHQKLLAALEERIDSDIPEYHEVKDIPYLDAAIDEG
jgi:benzoate 4-monooxygenase